MKQALRSDKASAGQDVAFSQMNAKNTASHAYIDAETVFLPWFHSA
ncbi:hypothetical protein C2W64_02181 [Brevibacillus laterosporus]|nr:hypothetical protein C2W64_02181 [Brevibacillus laterosporus]